MGWKYSLAALRWTWVRFLQSFETYDDGTNLYERFPIDIPLTPEAVHAAWEKITVFDSRSDNPESPQDGLKNVMQNLQNRKSGGKAKGSVNKEILESIEKAKKIETTGTAYEFDDKEVILYNLSLGAKRTDFKWVYEGNENFEALPTFGMFPGIFTNPIIQG